MSIERPAMNSKISWETLCGYLRNKAVKKSGRMVGRIRRAFGMTYRSPVDEGQLFALLDGKSVALVGNAQSLSQKVQGPEIDACDVVIRCNRAPIPNVASHGARTDFIATSTELEESIMAEKGASHILWMSPPRYALPGWIVRCRGFFLYPKRRHEVLSREVARPTTGLMVIDLLSASPCRSVLLFGFDFFKTGSISNMPTKTAIPHNGDAEESFVRTLIAKDTRFILK
ncbi:Glycosyltransferase family 29 (sialyltransferase) [compost metagenome]